MTWPPLSPDLNPIKMVWDELNRKVKEKQPTSAEHMWEILQDCWKSILGEADWENAKSVQSCQGKGWLLWRIRNLKYYLILFNTFLVTTWFHMCYFIDLMSSLSFYNVEIVKITKNPWMSWCVQTFDWYCTLRVCPIGMFSTYQWAKETWRKHAQYLQGRKQKLFVRNMVVCVLTMQLCWRQCREESICKKIFYEENVYFFNVMIGYIHYVCLNTWEKNPSIFCVCVKCILKQNK